MRRFWGSLTLVILMAVLGWGGVEHAMAVVQSPSISGLEISLGLETLNSSPGERAVRDTYIGLSGSQIGESTPLQLSTTLTPTLSPTPALGFIKSVLPWGTLFTIAVLLAVLVIAVLFTATRRRPRPVTQLRPKKSRRQAWVKRIVLGLPPLVIIIFIIRKRDWWLSILMRYLSTHNVVLLTTGVFVVALSLSFVSLIMLVLKILTQTQRPSLAFPLQERPRLLGAASWGTALSTVALLMGLLLKSRIYWLPALPPMPTSTPVPTESPIIAPPQATLPPSTQTPQSPTTPVPVSPTVTPTTQVQALAAGSTWVRPTDGATMVYVPAGDFLMGSADTEITLSIMQCEQDQGSGNCPLAWFEHQQPQHTVSLSAFWIDQTEVTNAQFADFLNIHGNQIENDIPWVEVTDEYCLIEQVGDVYQPKAGYVDHPVIEVTWAGASAYCEWVGGRLPTEAEWEYAARGAQSNIYPWGNTFECTRGNFDDETLLDDYVVAGSLGCDGYLKTAPVGAFPSGMSWCQALDMAGNVWEWVQDWYSQDYYAHSPTTDPAGPERGEYRLGRGGSWWSSEAWLHGAARLKISPIGAGYDLGFRCVAPETIIQN